MGKGFRVVTPTSFRGLNNEKYMEKGFEINCVYKKCKNFSLAFSFPDVGLGNAALIYRKRWLIQLFVTKINNFWAFRYWALAVPTYVMVTIVLVLGFYIGLNFISTPSPASLNTVFGEFDAKLFIDIGVINFDYYITA